MIEFNKQFADQCANDQIGPVALTLRQKLLPVEGKGSVIFPPTYAEIGYNIDELSDGTKVATVDSVGAQANRMEPLFKATASDERKNPLSRLVPQVNIAYGDGKSVSVLDVGHRLGDALVRSTDLADEANAAFRGFLEAGDASPIARLAPTSLVFGAWDSRDTQAKVPRILQAVIRAWDVDEFKRSAQYNPPVDYASLDVFSETEKKKQEGSAKSELAQRGFVHVPATREHGGIVVHGEIRRDVTINLIALRRLRSEQGQILRSYLLGIALAAATAPFDGFLRQGCLVTLDPKAPAQWEAVGRDGNREQVAIDERSAFAFAEEAAVNFGVAAGRNVAFSKARAKADAKKKA